MLSEPYRHYTIEESEKIIEFVEKDLKILDFIYEITPLLDEYFPNYEKLLELCEDSEFKDLNSIMIYIKGNDYPKDKLILNKFVKEPLYKSKFEKKIYGLVSVSLW